MRWQCAGLEAAPRPSGWKPRLLLATSVGPQVLLALGAFARADEPHGPLLARLDTAVPCFRLAQLS